MCDSIITVLCDPGSCDLIGVCCASYGSGLGEMTFLCLTSYYDKSTITAWASGTGKCLVLYQYVGLLVYWYICCLLVGLFVFVCLSVCEDLLVIQLVLVVPHYHDQPQGQRTGGSSPSLSFEEMLITSEKFVQQNRNYRNYSTELYSFPSV